jgi:hypothetical protein
MSQSVVIRRVINGFVVCEDQGPFAKKREKVYGTYDALLQGLRDVFGETK